VAGLRLVDGKGNNSYWGKTGKAVGYRLTSNPMIDAK